MNNNLDTFQNLVNKFQHILQNPDNFDLLQFDKTKARRIPPFGFRDDDTVKWENLQTGEYLIQDNLGKIRTYGTN